MAQSTIPGLGKTIIERTYFWSIALAIADFDEPHYIKLTSKLGIKILPLRYITTLMCGKFWENLILHLK